MDSESLNKIKAEVQKILDKHLEESQRFSIQDLDEESVFLLIDLLLEKDDIERGKIRARIEEEIVSHQLNIEVTYEQILEIKDKLDFQKNEISDLNDLEELINTEKTLDEELGNII